MLDEPNGEIVDMLLKAGVDVYKPDNYDELFFSNMVEKGWINTVKRNQSVTILLIHG